MNHEMRDRLITLRTMAMGVLGLNPFVSDDDDVRGIIAEADTGKTLSVDAEAWARFAQEMIEAIDAAGKLPQPGPLFETLTRRNAELESWNQTLNNRNAELTRKLVVPTGGFGKPRVNVATGDVVVWRENGDHPNDHKPWKRGKTSQEGFVVRRFRHPSVQGAWVCPVCMHPVAAHGWIEPDSDDGDPTRSRQTVCPGDLVTVAAPYKVFRRSPVEPSRIVHGS